MRNPSNYALRLPASLKKAAEEEARDGETLNAFIVSVVAEKVSAPRTADYFASRADLAAFDEILARPAGAPPPAADRLRRKRKGGT